MWKRTFLVAIHVKKRSCLLLLDGIGDLWFLQHGQTDALGCRAPQTRTEYTMVFSWLNVAIVLALMAGLAFASGPLIGSLLLAPKARGGELKTPYECGVRPYGSAKVRFGVNFFFYALIFLAFDVDVLYLFPVAVFYPQSEGLGDFYKLFVFLAVLALACIYFWKKGVFTWPRKIRFDKP